MAAIQFMRTVLAHPQMRGAALDDPRATALHRQIIREKKFLRRIYQEWYALLAGDVRACSADDGQVLELGSGAGFLDQFIPGLITSDVIPAEGARMAVDARKLPFEDDTLKAIVMTDVLHHIPDCASFFREAARCIRPGGRISMIEPWVTPWSRIVYSRFHHEPFMPAASSWTFPETGPLSSANGALPWIIFLRDRARFEQQFPEFRIDRIRPFMPLRYLLSGGVSMRSLAPGWSFPLCRAAENLLRPLFPLTAMFAHITLVRTAHRRAGP